MTMAHGIHHEDRYPDASTSQQKDLSTSRLPESNSIAGHSVDTHVVSPIREHEVEVVRERVLEHAGPEKPSLLFTSGGTSCPDSASDFSMLLRTFINIWMDSPELSAMGMTTAFNDFQGAIAASKAFERLKASQKIGDEWGTTEAQIDIARGIFQSLGGGLFTAVRPMSIACGLNQTPITPNSPSSLGQATYGVSTAGNIVFGAFYGIIAGWSGYNLYRTYRFKGKLNTGRNPDDLKNPENLKGYIDFLTNKRLHTSSKSTFEKLLKKYGNYSDPLAETKKALRKKAIASTMEWVKAVFDEVKDEKGSSQKISKKDCKGIAESLLTFIDEHELFPKEEMIKSYGFSPETDPDLFTKVSSLSFLELVGLEVARAQRQMKKEAKLERATSGDCVALIKEAARTNLSERLVSSDKEVREEALREAETLMEKVQASLSQNNRLNWALVIAGVLGLIVTILAFIFTGGIAAAALAFVMLAVTLLMMYVDISFLRHGLESDGPIGKWDKALVILNTVLCIASIIVAVVVASVLSMGIIPLVVSLAIGVLWLITCIVSYVMLNKKQKKYESNHPTLEALETRVKVKKGTDPINAKTRRLFERLPKVHRSMIKKHMAAGIPHAEVRRLKEEDRIYDRHFNFGYEFFQAHPLDDDVVKAVERIYARAPLLEIRALLDRMHRMKRGDVPVTEDALRHLRSYFHDHMSDGSRTLICGKIYEIRAKDGVSKYYHSEEITNAKLAEAIQERRVLVDQMRNAETRRMLEIFRSHVRSSEPKKAV